MDGHIVALYLTQALAGCWGSKVSTSLKDQKAKVYACEVVWYVPERHLSGPGQILEHIRFQDQHISTGSSNWQVQVRV